MSERMTDERLVEIERKFHDNNRRINKDAGVPVGINPDIIELLQALKAERAEVARLHALHLERTKFTDKVIRDKMAAEAKLLAAADGVQNIARSCCQTRGTRDEVATAHRIADELEALLKKLSPC